MHKLDGAGQQRIKEPKTRNFKSRSDTMQLVDCLQSTNATQTKETNKLQEEILMIQRPKTTRLMQLGGKYFE